MRSIVKVPAGMEDLAIGIGQEQQERGGQPVSVGKIDLPYAVETEKELADLDVAKYVKASFGPNTFSYSDAHASGSVKSNTGAGWWKVVEPAKWQKDLKAEPGIPYYLSPTYYLAKSSDKVMGVTPDSNFSVIGSYFAGESSESYTCFGGAVRFMQKGQLDWIKDELHKPINVGAAAIDGSDSRIFTLGYSFSAAKVITARVNSDETFALYGVQAGPSVAKNKLGVKGSMPVSLRTYNADAVGSVHSYFDGLITIAALGTGDGFKVNCPTMTNSDSSPQLTIEYTDSSSLVEGAIRRVSQTEFDVVCIAPISMVVAYSGSAWSVQSKMTTKPVISFASGQLTITVSPSYEDNDWSVTSMSRLYRPVVRSSTSSAVVIEFYDKDNARVEAADADMQVLVNRSAAKSPVAMPNNTRFLLSLGRLAIHWDNVADGASNFWVEGYHLA